MGSTSCFVSSMNVGQQIDQLDFADAAIPSMQVVFQQQWAIPIHLFQNCFASLSRIFGGSELREFLFLDVLQNSF